MSENIQSISMGTYTIGQTNNLTFEAGNGIKIDSPSAGTVRIGNDETVLWENTTGARLKDGIDLSESRLNFERLKIYMSNSEGNTQEVGIYEWPQYGQNTGTMFRWCTLFPYNTNSGGFMLMWNIMGSASNAHIQSNNAYYLGTSNFTGGASPSFIGGSNNIVPTVFKVIGINRISGNA